MNLVNNVARRKKRQDKLSNKKLVGGNITKTHYPSKDPDTSNHKRVVTQRVQSGRLDMDNYRKVKH